MKKKKVENNENVVVAAVIGRNPKAKGKATTYIIAMGNGKSHVQYKAGVGA